MALTDIDGGRLADNAFTLGKNLVINGKLQVDQYDKSVTSDSFFVDRWKYNADAGSKATVQKDNESPVDFEESIFVTSSSAYTVPSGETYKIRHCIEGYNIARLEFGTANAKTITLSFYVRSSLTGTFGGALRNSGATRSYPFTYSISSAGVWERKIVTIAGDTSGTWNVGNGIGIEIDFGLAVGSTFSGTAGSWSSNNYVSATGATSVLATNGATWYITGIQLEVGAVATPFEHRSYGDELARCQRYYYKIAAASNDRYFMGQAESSTVFYGIMHAPVTMRTDPTLETSGTATHFKVAYSTDTTCNAVPTLANSTPNTALIGGAIVASGLTANQAAMLGSVSASSYLALTAEL